MKDEKDKLTKAFLASAIAVILTGIVFIVIMIGSLIEVSNTAKKLEAEKHNLNCVTRPIEKSSTGCKE